MLPMPETRDWSSRARLTPLSGAASAAPRRRPGRSPARRGRGRCGRPSSGTAAVGAAAAGRAPGPPKVRWSTKRSCGPPSSKSNRACRCFSSGASAASTSSWPLMPRWTIRASSPSSASQRYLPRRDAAATVTPVRRAARSSGPATCRRATRRAEELRARRCAGRRRGPAGPAGRPRPRGAQAPRRRRPSALAASRRASGAALGAPAQLGPGHLGGLLLGLLLAAAVALAEHLVADDRRGR